MVRVRHRHLLADDRRLAADRPPAHRLAATPTGSPAPSSSVGSRGDSYDNALAENTIGLYKTEPIHRRSTWKSLDDVELATMEWVDRYNNRRIHRACQIFHPPNSKPSIAQRPTQLSSPSHLTRHPSNPARFTSAKTNTSRRRVTGGFWRRN
ncbi:integrase core domain-containing protein [Nonomuraea angiospora]|uniref:integrase core domain-containing protein n=1 Tax=Nonomuraea angiospora TaxID=46172 RepID=UPI0037B5700F